MVGLRRITPFFIAFAYHSMSRCGTLGGFRLNEPVMLKCGILSFGNSHLKLTRPLIFSIPSETVFLMLSQVSVTVFFAPSKASVIDFLIDSNFSFMVFHKAEAPSLMVSQFFAIRTPAAIAAPIAMVNGPPSTATTVPIPLTSVPPMLMTEPTVLMTPPMIPITGPIAATSKPNFTMFCFVESSRPSHFSFAPLTTSATV